MTSDAALERVQTGLGYRFQDAELLREARIHRSFAAEEDIDDSYERLEFLGDAVLQLAVTHHLYEAHPHLSEGMMAKVRAAVVNERTLAAVARDWCLGDVILLGRGEDLTGGRNKDSILSDVCESLIGAVYVEAGFHVACDVVLERWRDLIAARVEAPGRRDYKTRLQEDLARTGRKPRYEVDQDGPEHAKQFTARVFAEHELLGSGEGTSKKRAEQEAARNASARLEGSIPPE